MKNSFGNKWGFADFLQKKHLAKSEKTANRLLIILSSLLIIISLGLFVLYGSEITKKPKQIYKLSSAVYQKLPPNIQIKLIK